MHYRRDFTIGLKETQDFYTTVALGHWWKGIFGFGLAGGLVAWMYLIALQVELNTAAELGITFLAALITVFVVALTMVLVTRRRVKKQLGGKGQEQYVQQTEINGFGVYVTVGEKEAHLGFDKLVKVQETKKGFYVFLSPTRAWLLPKAQMEDEAAESKQLREIFSTVMESGRLKLKK